MSIANRGNRWQSVNDIAERARFDDQDLQRHDWKTLILIFSPGEKEPFSRPARVATEWANGHLAHCRGACAKRLISRFGAWHKRRYNDAKVKRTIERRLK